MVYCAVQWCKNDQGKSQSKIEGRQFLRFFKLPKDVKLAKSWKLRIGRRPEDVTDKMHVCSDHFADDDFANITKIRTFYYEGMHIKLTPTAVPNTDPESRCIVKSNAMDSACPTPPQRSRKRVRRDLASIDSLIQEQEEIFQNSSIMSDPGNERDIVTDDIISSIDEPNADGDQCEGTQTQCTCVCSCFASQVYHQPARSKFASTQTETR
jgi:hypothetical protein